MPSLSTCKPYRELIELELGRGRNATGIWQDLVDMHGFPGCYQSVKRYVRKLLGTASAEARAVIQTQPGEEYQVDYGTGPMVRDPDTGKYHRTLALAGISRLSFSLNIGATGSRVPQKSLIWIHAASKPDAARAGLQGSPRTRPRGHYLPPGFDIVLCISTRH